MVVKDVFKWIVGAGFIAFSVTKVDAALPILDHRYELLPMGDEVRDLKTKLIWQRCLIGQEWNGVRCTGLAQKFTFAQALRQGDDSWRVPSRTELESIIDHSGVKPAIHRRAFLGVGGDVWTASTTGTSHLAWAVSFSYGFSYAALRSNTFTIRLVRN